MEPLGERLPHAAFAFRGYNTTNIGRSAELLAHKVYGSIVARQLQEASAVCSHVVQRRVDLVALIKSGGDPALAEFPEAVSLILAMEIAQLKLLEEFFDIHYHDAKLAYGYSLGEIGALIAGGVFDFDKALEIPLMLAVDCAELAADCTMGVLFSRGPAIELDNVHWLCMRINSEGLGTIAVSSILSPNTVLLIGQRNTVERFSDLMTDLLGKQVHLRRNQYRWPPLHTSILWERQIPDRAGRLMQNLPGGLTKPVPDVLSLVTGKTSYNDHNSRDLLRKWTDHPQRLWDAVCETLGAGIETVIHVGPSPNLIPATFARVAENVRGQMTGHRWSKIGLRAVSQAVRRPWLAKLLPSRSTLLRAPFIEHVILEDWLLGQNIA